METVIVIEVLAAHDRIRTRHRFAFPGASATCTLGRGAIADVIIDDPYVAALHARIDVDADGRITVTDLGSRNGIEIHGRHEFGVAGVALPDGHLRVGHTRIRVRTAHEHLPIEAADRGASPMQTRARDMRLLALGFAVAVATTIFGVWTMTAQPRELTTAIVTFMLGLFAIAGLWITLWALASRVAFGESRWVRHAAIFFGVLAIADVGSSLSELMNGAFGLHLSPLVAMLFFGIAAAAALAAHLISASPMRPRLAAAIGLVIPVLAISVIQWTTVRSQNRSANFIPNRDEVLPPALVFREGGSLAAFATKISDLPSRADAKRAFVEKEDPSPGEESSLD